MALSIRGGQLLNGTQMTPEAADVLIGGRPNGRCRWPALQPTWHRGTECRWTSHTPRPRQGAHPRAQRSLLQAAPTEGLLALTENTIRLWHGAAGGRIRVAVAPTIPGQCSDDFWLGCGRLAQEYGVGLHTHLAESKVQAVYAQRGAGEQPSSASWPISVPTIVASCSWVWRLTW